MSDLEGPPATWVSSACTLPTVDQPVRVAEFDEFFSCAVRSVRRVDATRVLLELDGQPGTAARTADLASRETRCCSFFTFTLMMAADHLALTITTTPAHTGILAALADRVDQLSGVAT